MSDLRESTARHRAAGEAVCDDTVAFAEAAAFYGRHAAPVDAPAGRVLRLLPPLAPEPADDPETVEKPTGGLWARLRGFGRAA